MPSLHPFFDRYMAAYLRGEPGGFAAFFELPSLIVDAGGSHVIDGTPAIEAYMQPFLARLAEAGLTAIDYEVLSSAPLDTGDCFCTNRYRILGADRCLLGDMTYHYYLRPGGDDWRMSFARQGAVHDWQL